MNITCRYNGKKLALPLHIEHHDSFEMAAKSQIHVVGVFDLNPSKREDYLQVGIIVYFLSLSLSIYIYIYIYMHDITQPLKTII